METLHILLSTCKTFNGATMELLRLNIHMCSATLTELCLNVDLYYWSSDLKTCAGFACSGLKVSAHCAALTCLSVPEGQCQHASIDLQDTICQSKQLCSLQLMFGADEADGAPLDAGSLLMEFSAALPKLTVLHWREAALGDDNQRVTLATRWTFEAFMDKPWMGKKAAEPLAGPGLRLLQAEQCNFETVDALPSSLQICSLRHWGREHPPLRGRFDLLLAPCAALRELHILQCTLGKGASVDLPVVAASCPALRVLVLHVFMECAPGVSTA